MGKKVVGIIFVCILVLVAIAIAVIASTAGKPGKGEEVTKEEEEEDFFCCRDRHTKIVRSKV